MLKRFIPLALAGPLIAGAALVAPVGGQAQAACSVSSYLTQTPPEEGDNDVECLQAALNEAGFDSGPVDGWFGPVTHGAVRAFQEAKGLTVDGQVGRETGSALGIWDGSSQPRQQAQQPRQQSSGGSASSGDCYASLFAKYGLPVGTFQRIAQRESGCNPSAYVCDHDDEGGGLLGINFKGSNAGVWMRLCGATVGQVTNVETNVRCAAAAYRQSGLGPWSGGA